MKRKALSAVIGLALLGGSAVASAQWYIAPRVGGDYPDDNRKTSASWWGGIGVGVWVTPHIALDLEYTINNADFKNNSWRRNKEWENAGLDVAGRWFFLDEGTAWRPYIMVGVGALRSQAYSGQQLNTVGYQGNTWNPMATVGVGVQYNMSQRLALRGELAARYDHDNNTRGNFSQALGYPIEKKSGYTDGILSIALVINFGGSHEAPPPEQPHETPPPVQPAQEPVAAPPPTIDLRGVNFKFDRPKPGEKRIEPTLQVPASESIAILDQAVDVLKRTPEMRVELDGHTDAIGSEAYNQKLSERRAQIVYGYLTAHGVNASQITGVKGFGKSQPIDTNATKEGRARNRRTEMHVQQ